MTTYTDRVCTALTGLLESRTEWDEAPGLYFLYAHDGEMRLSERSIVPDEIWPSVPTRGLAAMAQVITEGPLGELLKAVAPPNLAGTVFLCEVWGVTMARDDSPAREHAEALLAERRLSEHPGRVEQRIAWAVLRDGAQFFAKQDRGSEEVTAQRVTVTTTGLIPDSLARITRAVTAEAN
jgi:hypothetical protein